jgi:hypothetical protein
LTYIKPKPIIQKITFSKEDQENIDALLSGMPTKKAIEGLKSRGMNVELWLKRKAPSQKEYLKKRVKQQYYKSGFCCCCNDLPTHRAIYKMEGANLIENYCESHFRNISLTN